MMEFHIERPRARVESVVPMINVVFLLLVFFLMTATLAPPDPFETVPPSAERTVAAEPGTVLFVGAGGELALGELRGEQIYEIAGGSAESLVVRADARLEAARLTAILSRLAANGVTEIRLIAVRR